MPKTHDENYYEFKPITENPIILDFLNCENLWSIHDVLKNKFGFPDYYGRNWSALWDCIDGLFDDEETITVEIHSFTKLEKELRESCMKMLEIFDRVHETTPNVVFKMIP